MKSFYLIFLTILVAFRLDNVTSSGHIPIESYITYTNDKLSETLLDPFSIAECKQTCELYDKCESFLYYDDFKCYLFYLGNSITAFNQKIGYTFDHNYVFGFKTQVLTRRIDSLFLGKFFFMETNQVNDTDCIKSCLNFENCIGVSFDSLTCYMYNETSLAAKTTWTLDPKYISYIVSDHYEKIAGIGPKSAALSHKSSTVLSDSPIQLDGFELLNSYDGTYTQNAKQCWLHCEANKECIASSFTNKYYEPNEALSNVFNCFFYKETYKAVENKFWQSFISIKGYQILNFKKKIPRLENLNEYETSNLKECLDTCSLVKKCYGFHYDHKISECVTYLKVSSFSTKDIVTLDTNKQYILKKNSLASFNESCSSDNDCHTENGLKCADKVCLCADINDHWSGSEDSCEPCRSGWKPFMNTCYKYRDIEVSWTEANHDCEKTNSTLVILDDVNKLMAYQRILDIARVGKSQEVKYYKTWVKGTKMRPNSFTWISDGSQVDLSFTFEDLTRHLENSGEFCGGFDASVNSKLNDMYCYNRADFICEFKCESFSLGNWAKEKTMSVLKISDTPRKECRKCRDNKNNGWMSYKTSHSDELCYKYFSLPNGATWHEAKKFCEERETYLLELKNQFKFNDFREKFNMEKQLHHSKSKHVKAWLGLSSLTAFSFFWGDPRNNNMVDSEFWAKNLPDNGDKVCVALDVSNGYKLNNFNCYSLYGFFCEYDVELLAECATGHTRYKNTCMSFVNNDSNEANNWYGAKQYCESQNSTLLTLKTKEKMAHVQAYLKVQITSLKTRAWVGAAKILPEEISWVKPDGQTREIEKRLWADRERKDHNKNCAAMDGYYGNKLSNFDCNMENGFFCEYY